MNENSPNNELSTGRRIRWIIFAVLILLLLVGLCLGLGQGRALLDSLIPGAGTAPEATSTEEISTEEVTEEATTEAPPPPQDTPQDTPTSTAKPTEEVTPEATDTEVVSIGNGGCFAACDPANSNCVQGLVCVPGTSDTGNVCWSEPICHPVSEPSCNNNGVCEADEIASCADCISTQPPCACGDGVCEQDRCNELIQTCPADCDPCAHDPNACKPSVPCVCGDGICNENPSCGEGCQGSCSTDCEC